MTRPAALGRPGSHVADPNLWRSARAVQSGGMPATLRVERLEGFVVDPQTLVESPDVTVVYEGPGRFQPMTGLNERRVIIGAETRTTNRYVAAVPWDAPAMRVDDVVVVLDDPDPGLVDRSAVVRDVSYDTFGSRRILICEDDPERLTPEAEDG